MLSTVINFPLIKFAKIAVERQGIAAYNDVNNGFLSDFMSKNILKIDQINRISSRSPHSAFTDLHNLPDGSLLCCYRQATNHVSSDGTLEITLLSARDRKVESRSRIAIAGVDLRDPKLSQGPDGRIWLLANARYADAENTTLKRHMMSWFSYDGTSWSSPHDLGLNHWWLWRIIWRDDEAYGFAYHRGHDRIDLYRGHPGKRMFCFKSHALGGASHNLSYPNESDMHVDNNSNMWALVRRDADSFSAQLGFSKAPFTRWYWHDLGVYIGGPAWVPLTASTMLVAGREWTGKALVTTLWTLNLSNKRLEKILTLPSGGDNSYPGLAIDGDTLYVSYYSGHLDNDTRVYLARLQGITALSGEYE